MAKAWEVIDRFDIILVLITGILISFGTLMIWSTTRVSQLHGSDAKSQLYWAGIGFIALVLCAVIDFRKLTSLSWAFYGFMLFLLVDVLFLGDGGNDVERWIPLGSFHLQPSELAKLTLIVTLAAYLRRSPAVRLRDMTAVFALTAVPVFLVLVQPNLGTAIVLLIIMAGMLFVAGIKARWIILFTLITVLLIGAVFDMHVLKDYQTNRLLVFMDPDLDPLGAGYNLAQSKIAIGSGGMSGKGLFEGTQSRLNFIPARHTDFIFAVVGEELGFMGAAVLIGLYLIFLSRALRIAGRCTDRSGALIAGGIVSMFLFQIFVNIGMTIGIMPITGLPLPFLSYGGSALITNMAAVGLLLNINWRYRPRGLTLANGYLQHYRMPYRAEK